MVALARNGPLTAVMVMVPGLCAVTSPVASGQATLQSDDAQLSVLTVRSPDRKGCAEKKRCLRTNCCALRTFTVAEGGSRTVRIGPTNICAEAREAVIATKNKRDRSDF